MKKNIEITEYCVLCGRVNLDELKAEQEVKINRALFGGLLLIFCICLVVDVLLYKISDPSVFTHSIMACLSITGVILLSLIVAGI